jgi:hypothetical protein
MDGKVWIMWKKTYAQVKVKLSLSFGERNDSSTYYFNAMFYVFIFVRDQKVNYKETF